MSNNNDNKLESRLALDPGAPNFLWATIISFFFLAGCATQTYQSEPVEPQVFAEQRIALDHNDAEFKAFLLDNNVKPENWPLQRFDLAALTLIALYFNPSIQVARSQIDIAMANETIAGQRANPDLNFPDEARDTLDFFGLIGDFLLERPEKRKARQAAAQAQREAAELGLVQQAWSVYSGLHTDLIDYYAATRVSELLGRRQSILKEGLQLLEQRVAAGEASEFELSSIRLELQQTELLISNQQYLINDSFHRLISHTGLLVDKFNQQEIDFAGLQNHLQPDTNVIDALQFDLLNSRFDIKKMLAEYNAYEARLKLEIEKQYPDITLSPGFLFEQGQALWILGATWVLPVFHNNDGQIQQALAERKTKQFEFMQLQASLISELNRKKQNYIDRLAAYERSQQLLTAQEARGIQIEKQFRLGYSDRLALLRSRLEIEKARQAMFDIELDVMRAAVQLETVTQSPVMTSVKQIDFTQPGQHVDKTQ